MEIIVVRKLLIAAALLATCGLIIVTPAFVARQALAADSKCLNKANKHVACTGKRRAEAHRKKVGGSVWAPHWETTAGGRSRPARGIRSEVP